MYMKKVLYILNDCMRKFTYERTAGFWQALQRLDEPVDLHIVRSDGYSEYAPEHNCGEYNILFSVSRPMKASTVSFWISTVYLPEILTLMPQKVCAMQYRRLSDLESRSFPWQTT